MRCLDVTNALDGKYFRSGIPDLFKVTIVKNTILYLHLSYKNLIRGTYDQGFPTFLINVWREKYLFSGKPTYQGFQTFRRERHMKELFYLLIPSLDTL